MILRYLDGRFLTATEAEYDLLGFLLHKESVFVICLLQTWRQYQQNKGRWTKDEANSIV